MEAFWEFPHTNRLFPNSHPSGFRVSTSPVLRSFSKRSQRAHNGAEIAKLEGNMSEFEIPVGCVLQSGLSFGVKEMNSKGTKLWESSKLM